MFKRVMEDDNVSAFVGDPPNSAQTLRIARVLNQPCCQVKRLIVLTPMTTISLSTNFGSRSALIQCR